MNGWKTKTTGILMVIVAIANTATDALDGGGFNYKAHIVDISLALQGAGFYFLRDALAKLFGKYQTAENAIANITPPTTP